MQKRIFFAKEFPDILLVHYQKRKIRNKKTTQNVFKILTINPQQIQLNEK